MWPFEAKVTNDFLLEYIGGTKVFKEIKKLFWNFFESDLILLDAGGTAAAPSRTLTNPPVSAKKTLCAYGSGHPQKYLKMNTLVLDQMHETRQTVVSTCANGYKLILVPIVVKEKVIGIFAACENPAHRLKETQIESILSLLQRLADEIIQKELKYYEELRGSTLTHKQKLLKKVMQYIYENYDTQDLSLSDIAKKHSISYHYLSRMFKRELKTTFSQYRQKVRLDVSSRLLRDRSLTVSQISYSCGFDDPGYFSRVFKEHFGKSPLDFRKRFNSSPRSRRLKLGR